MGEKSETERSGLYEELKSQILQRVDLSREVSDEEMQELIDEVIEREQELLSQGVQITDDAMVVEYVCEHPVKLVQGSYENMKLTTPDDLEVAEAFLQKRL